MDLKTLLRNLGQPRQPLQGGKGVIFFVILFSAVILVWRTTGLITDWFWFQEVGYEKIFAITLLAQFQAAALFGIAFFLIFYVNLFLASRLSERIQLVHREGAIPFPPWGIDALSLKWLILSASLVFSLFAALQATPQWENLLRFLNVTPFGVSDPLFGRDIGFYVFQLPFLRYIYGWLMTVLVMATLATGAPPTVPVPFATVHVWVGLAGWVSTVTAYAAPLATGGKAKLVAPLAIGRLPAPFSWSTRPEPARPVTVPPTA